MTTLRDALLAAVAMLWAIFGWSVVLALLAT